MAGYFIPVKNNYSKGTDVVYLLIWNGIKVLWEEYVFATSLSCGT